MSNSNDIEEVFHAALEYASVNERNAFLDRACSDSPAIRAQVDRLLESHEKASDFMEQSPTVTFGEIASKAPDEDATTPPTPPVHSSFILDEQLPRKFGDYELLDRIAAGGMGVVFKARQISLNRVVAIKMILSGQFAGQDEIKRFYVEAEAAGKLDHAGIVPVFDVGHEQGCHYFSMAFIDGPSLAARIKEGPLPPREAAAMTRQVAVAIQFAHDRGIVHRDLKPGNVMLDKRSEPRVTDFGLAKQVEGGSQLTTTGMVLGTPSYMPPEQAAGKEIGAAADVYSLGAILYAMLTGRPPFEGPSQLETILHVLQDEPTAPRKIDKKIPKDLEAICLKCLEKNVADRYKTAAELSADLRQFLSGEPIQARNDMRRRFRKWSLREPVFAAHLMATLVLLAMLIINYRIWRGDNVFDREHNLQLLKGNIGILFGWAVAVLVFQKTQNKFQTRFVIPFTWAAINPVFLTIALSWNDPPREWLLSLYYLLIVTSSFFRRAEIVAITTMVSLIGYAVLVVFCIDTTLPSASYKVVFAVNMVVTGALLVLLTVRMKRLGEQHTM